MRLILTTLGLMLMIAGSSMSALAHDYRVGGLQIDHPWARAMPEGAATGAGYMMVRNLDGGTDRLLGGSTPRADQVELHDVTVRGEVVEMRRLHAIEIPVGATAELKPGSLHLMFLGVTEPFRVGERVPVTLVFDRAGEVEVEFVVEALGSQESGHHDHDHDHDDH